MIGIKSDFQSASKYKLNSIAITFWINIVNKASFLQDLLTSGQGQNIYHYSIYFYKIENYTKLYVWRGTDNYPTF